VVIHWRLEEPLQEQADSEELLEEMALESVAVH
jgi:hypothetical protein